MIELTLKEYNAIHTDYRGVWSTERTDWPDWESVRAIHGQANHNEAGVY
jgi:hypothetical protein